MKEGDHVFYWTGTKYRHAVLFEIQRLSEWGSHDDMYCVCFDDGEEIACGRRHLTSVAGMNPNDISSSSVLVAYVLLSVIPPGLPPSFNRVIKAKFIGSKRNRICATLEMFDGAQGSVECWKWSSNSWAHRWTDTGGSSVFWNGEWKRIMEATK